MSVTITKDNVAKMLKAVSAMTTRHVLVGIPAETAERQGDEINNAAIGYMNEMGSPSNNIPPRPHLVPGIEKASPAITALMQKAGSAALSGKMDKIEEGFNAVGLTAVSSVRTTITAVIPPPLSPKTLAKRRAKGHAGETPLIDTGAYRQALTYVIRDKE